MAELLKKTIQNEFRPIINIETYGGNLTCLIDTGANISVFTIGKEYIRQFFPDAKLVSRYDVALSGFGNGETKAELYYIKRLKIKSDIDDDYINIENVYIACCSKLDIGAGLVLAYGTFDEMGLSIKRKLGMYGEIWIEHDYAVYNGKFHLDKNRKSVKRTSVQTQSELTD